MSIANELGPCSCSQLRRTARKLSAFYDEALKPAGITVTQYSLLVNIARAEAISRTGLAVKLGMDRTTLTRNLLPLTKKKLIASAVGEDRREHLLRLSSAGQRLLERSRPLWEEAQRTFGTRLGVEVLAEFRAALTAAERAVAQELT